MISECDFESLAGIEFFKDLLYLSIWECNKLVTVDASNLSSLLEISMYSNERFENVILTGLDSLSYLSLMNNKSIKVIDLSTLTSLETFICSYNDQLTSILLPLSGILSYAELAGNNSLVTLEIIGVTSLEYLMFNENRNLESITLSGLTNLTYLNCNYNKLTTLNLTGLINLWNIDCYENKLTSLDLRGAPNLIQLQCQFNNITSIDLTGLMNLEYLNCSYNYLASKASVVGFDINDWDELNFIFTPQITSPEIISGLLADGKENEDYWDYLFCDTYDIVWSITYGNLPNGLVLNEDGTITGIPTAGGSFNFIVRATNRIGYDEKVLSITIKHVLTHVDEIAPDCINGGNIECWYCANCDKYFLDDNGENEITEEETLLGALDHDLTCISAVDPTCNQEGNKEYWQCARCNEYFTDENGLEMITLEETVIAARHNLTHVEEILPTCEDNGNIEYWHCEDCGGYCRDSIGADLITLDQTVVLAIGHNMTKHDRVGPTCTLDGNIDYWSCKNCNLNFIDLLGNGEVLLEDTKIAPIGHVYGNWVVAIEPTRSSLGRITGTCLHDATHVINEDLPILNDTDYTYLVTTDPTPDATGIGRYTLIETKYGSVYFEITLDMLGHNYTREVVDSTTLRSVATCTSEATYWYTCEDCELISLESFFKYGAPLGHDFVSWTVSLEPTLTAGGTITGTCSHDNSHIKDEPLPGLNYVDYTYTVESAATCTSSGVGRFTLNDTSYGEIYFEVEIVQLGHSYVWEVTTDPTISSDGEWTGICAHDRSHVLTDPISALNTTDYTYEVISAPTCTLTGIGRYTLIVSKAGETSFDVIIQADGHSLEHTAAVNASYSAAGNSEYWHCSVCNKYFSNVSGINEITLSSTVIAKLIATLTPSTESAIPANFFNGYQLGAALAAPSREGYVFGGWFKDAGFTTPVSSITEIDLDSTGNVILYANWTAVEDPEGGLSTGAIVGIVTGSVLVVGIGGFSILWFIIKKKKFADLLAMFKKK